LSKSYERVFAAVGVHPNSALAWNHQGSLVDLHTLAKSKKVVAIDENGLDYYRKRAPHEVQRVVFQAQFQVIIAMSLDNLVIERDRCPFFIPPALSRPEE